MHSKGAYVYILLYHPLQEVVGKVLGGDALNAQDFRRA